MVRTPSIKELRRTANKQSTAGFLNPMCDWLAFYPAKLFLYLPFCHTQITLIWIIIKIIMALLIIKGNFLLTVVALTFFQLASILDGVDGIVYRVRKCHSYNAIYFDYLGHYLCNSLLLICLAIGTYHSTGKVASLIAGAIAVYSFLLSKAITMNGIWVNNLQVRQEMESIIYGEQFSMKSQKNKVVAWIADFFLMDNPLNFMFFGVLAAYFFSNAWLVTLWVYALILTLELFRRMFLQYWRVKKYEQKKKQEQSN